MLPRFPYNGDTPPAPPPPPPPPTGQTTPQVPGIPTNQPTTGVPMNTYGAYQIDWQDADSKSMWMTFFGAGSTAQVTVEKLLAEGWTLSGTYLLPPEGEKGRLKIIIPTTGGGTTGETGTTPPASGYALASLPWWAWILLIGALAGAAFGWFKQRKAA